MVVLFIFDVTSLYGRSMFWLLCTHGVLSKFNLCNFSIILVLWPFVTIRHGFVSSSWFMIFCDC
jgi:uncharacterized membrane protein